MAFLAAVEPWQRRVGPGSYRVPRCKALSAGGSAACHRGHHRWQGAVCTCLTVATARRCLRSFEFQRQKQVRLDETNAEEAWSGVQEESEIRTPGGGISRVVCFRDLCPSETVLSVREYLKDQVYDTLFDSVDLAPSWEFYPVTRGEWQDDDLEPLLSPFIHSRLLPALGSLEMTSPPVLSEILVRRYRPGERRSHAVHYDGHAYATAVLGISTPEEFQGGLYLQPEACAESRRFCNLSPGDVVLHSFNLQHGVDVFEGERYSVIFWFKDSEASVKDGSTPWYDKMAAESSDTSVDALYNLGVQFELGVHGKEKDFEKAKDFYRNAAERGHHFAQNNLALLEADDQVAEIWLRAASEKGHSTAQMNLAIHLLCQDENDPTAAEWMQLAASQEPKAAFYMGDMYRRGVGVAEDLEEAAKWFRRSADRGFFRGFTELGLLSFATGDFEEAAQLFEAAVVGDPEAWEHLVTSRRLAYGESEVTQWGKLAERGHPEALYRMGMCFLHGDPETGYNEDAAIEMLQLAAESGHSAALDTVEQLQTRSQHPKGQDMVKSHQISPFYLFGMIKGSSFRYRFLTFLEKDRAQVLSCGVPMQSASDFSLCP